MRRAGVCGLLVAACAVCGCERPFLASDGTLVFQQKGAHGASVLTANGLEFHDTRDVPDRVVVRDPYEPWRAPLGFIVPASGRFTKTSSPTVVASSGLSVTLRPSDTRVPSWGGEMLVRVDVMAPATKQDARWGEDVAIVVDGRGPDTASLCEAAVAQLGARDRVTVVDTAGARVVVPLMPASNRSLVVAAVARRLAASAPAPPVDRAGAARKAMAALSRATLRRVIVLSDAPGAAREEAAQAPGEDMVPVEVVATRSEDGGDDRDARTAQVRAFVPPAGDPAFGDVVLSFEGTPAPSHVLEASGGDARWRVEGVERALGDGRAGDARTEVVRVTIPAWTPGEAFTLRVTARFDDLTGGAGTGAPRRAMAGELPCVYDDDIERIAESRHGDVIAYASALATLARLDAAFVGGDGVTPTPAGLRDVARLHARSLAALAHDMHDPSSAAQAAMLEALLDATDF
jgi:hypothetical protein